MNFSNILLYIICMHVSFHARASMTHDQIDLELNITTGAKQSMELVRFPTISLHSLSTNQLISFIGNASFHPTNTGTKLTKSSLTMYSIPKVILLFGAMTRVTFCSLFVQTNFNRNHPYKIMKDKQIQLEI